MDWLVSVLEYIAGSFNEIVFFFTTSVPDMISRMFVYGIEYAVLLKINTSLWFAQFAFGIAQQIMADLGLPALIVSSLSGLPADLQWVLGGLRFADSLNFILDALTARFVMNFMGW